MKRVPKSGMMMSGRIRRRLKQIAACVLILSMTSFGSVRAQQTTPQPRLDPNRTEKNFDALQTEQRRAKERAIPLPRVAKPKLLADTKPLFTLTAISVEGARVLPGDIIAEAYQSYIGRTVSQADLIEITGKISDLYQDAGYHLSRAIIPPQDIKDGRIGVQVIEGKITEIDLKGNGAEQYGVRRLLAAVVAEQPARLKTLERQLLLVNDRPGVRVVDTALEEIGVATGNFRLIVDLETWHIYAALGLDNRGTSQVGPMQAYWSSALNSAFIQGDTLGLNLSTIPTDPRELGFGRLSYELPIGAEDARLGASASHGEIWPSGNRRKLNTRTLSETYELRGSIIPLRSRTSSLWLTASAGYSDVSESDNLGTNYSDHIRIVSLAADYRTNDELDGWNYLTLVLRQGIPALGASAKGDDALSRYGASGKFSKFEYSYTRYQKLSDIWSLKLSVSGQVASAPLLTSQQFYVGGAAFGRGYDSGDFSGDNGVAGSLELRFDQKLDHEFFKGYQLYSFIDKGAVWNFGDDFKDIVSPSSAGAGMRFYLADELLVGVEVAAPLDYRTTTNEKRDPRVFFSLAKSFKLCPSIVHMHCS